MSPVVIILELIFDTFISAVVNVVSQYACLTLIFEAFKLLVFVFNTFEFDTFK